MTEALDCCVTEDSVGVRLDVWLAQRYPEASRGRIQQWIAQSAVQVNDRLEKPSYKLRFNDQIACVPPAPVAVVDSVAEDIELDVQYQDEDIIVIYKPPGLVMHPAVGNPKGTVLNALLYAYPELEKLPRAGIVHRLDKNTSGLVVIARSLRAHTSLVRQLSERTVSREYDAIVCTYLVSGGRVDAAIGRHPTDRTKQAVRADGREAITHYRVKERFRVHTWLQVKLETGRTHQIRVHMSHLRHPIVGDGTYGYRARVAKGMDEALRELLQQFPRQALHARRLELIHPGTNEAMSFEVPMPSDMLKLTDELRADAKEHAQ